MRRIATTLRPSVLDQIGLAAALEWQGQEFRQRTGIDVVVEQACNGVPVPADLSSSAFRIVQESLTNVARHAKATHVTIRLAQTSTLLTLEVIDNGVGCITGCFDGTKSLGLVGMRERALACGGELTITGKPGRGTTVLMRVPYNAAVAQ